LLEKGVVPPFRTAVNAVRWKPEPPGDEHFDHAAVVLGRGWGDCDDLAPWHAASLRATGQDPGARAFVKKSGPNRWHAVVRRSDGSVDDPSKEAGMGQRTNGVLGGALPMMMRPSSVVGEVGTYVARPQLALRPVFDRTGQPEAWQARADLPWHWVPGKSPTDVAMVSLHASPVSSQAVAGACEGLINLGEANDVDDEILARAACISDAVQGASWDELEEVYGPEHATAAGQLVGSFFGGLTKPFRKLGRKLTRPITRSGVFKSLKRGYESASPYLTAAFPATAAFRDLASAAQSGDPMAVMKARMMPGAQSAREAFSTVPGGGLAHGLMAQTFGNLPGASQWFGQAAPMQQAAAMHASPELQANIARGYHLPPEYAAQQYPPGYNPWGYG
jgi:hypothetical protein